jgi:hypothetical protein
MELEKSVRDKLFVAATLHYGEMMVSQTLGDTSDH